MSKNKRIDNALMCQARERAWLIMAFISSALSDHPVVKSRKSYRQLTDQSRKALFDLHNEIESVLLSKDAVRACSPATRSESTGAGPHPGRRLRSYVLAEEGNRPPSVRLDFDDDPRAIVQQRARPKQRS